MFSRRKQNCGAMSKNDPQDDIDLLDALEKLNCEDSYYEFFKSAWKIIHPVSPLVDNWHFKYICDELQKEIHRIGKREKKTTDLITEICPRSGKSLIFSVMLTPWAWIHYPWMKFINSSYKDQLSTEHLVFSRDIIRSDWYQKNWGHLYQLTGDQNQKGNYHNDKRGSRLACSVGAPPLGRGADVIISDDLLDPMSAASEADRKSANMHFDLALYNRLNDPSIGLRVLIMQRLHEDDTIGHAIKNNPDGYRKITIPADTTAPISPPELIENYRDGLFFSERFNNEILDAAKRVLGPTGYACQYLQAIRPDAGNIYQRGWFNFYGSPPQEFDVVRSYWDLSFKAGPKNSYVVGQVWGRKEKRNYLLYQFREKTGIVGSMDAIIASCKMFRMCTDVVVEDKANGPAVMEQLKNVIPGIRGWPDKGEPMSSKESRWMAAAPIARGGDIWLPDPISNPWVEEFILELITLPNSTYKDQADVFAMMCLDMNKDSLEDLKNFVRLYGN